MINLNKSRRLDHLGIRVELVGVIENLFDKSHSCTFLQLVRDLEPPGTLTDNMNYDFAFNRVEKQFESYNGIVVRVRYYVNVIINRSYNKITREEEICVMNLGVEPELNPPIKMEVGIEECLHIEFEFTRSKFHLKDCIVGIVRFNLVRIKIRMMELAIIRKETVGSGATAVTENETLTRFELMDGAPVKGEEVPVRFFMASTDLTPSYKNVNNRFKCCYWLNLVLIDEEDRRYFK
jgi:vacuolar protein sorting-associated protein 26